MAKLKCLCISLLLALTAFSGCSGKPAAVAVSLGEPFSIGIGQDARITGEDLLITFNEMIGDSRCPQNATCIWAGIASCQVTMLYQGAKYSMALNQPGLTEQAQERFMDYSLAFSITPYPTAGQTISPSNYRLNLTVTAKTG